MPNPSITNERMYRALRRQGMSKARAARISNAARFKAATLATLEAYVSAADYAPPIAQALASLIPELPAFKGESLGPGITRIRGNLCNMHGRYGPCDAAQSGKKPPKGKKPVKAPEQRQAERQAARSQQQQANRASVASALADADASLGPTGVASVLAAMDGGEITNGPALETLGYAEKNPDGSYRLTPEARALARAAGRGDARGALDADGRAQARAAKLAAAAGKKKPEEKPKGGGGGGKAKPNKAAEAATNRASVGTQLGLNLDALNSAATGGRVSDVDRVALTKRGLLADDGQPTDAAQKLLAAADKGDARAAQAALVSQTRQAVTATERRQQQAARDADREQRRADTAGRRADTDRRRAAADKRQLRAERRAAARAENAAQGLRKRRKEAEPMREKAQSDQEKAMFAKMGGGGGGGGGSGKGGSKSRLWGRDPKTGTRKPTATQHRALVNRAQADRKKLGREVQRYDAIRAAAPKNSNAGKDAARNLRKIGTQLRRIDNQMAGLPDPRSAKSFTVYKAADGTPRWLARSTTAYRDRDGEILSVAALDADSQRMTATKQYGPLRWWHVGQPDPANPAAPWGPGLDLGTCDFSTVIGRTRVESGTFKSVAIARAVARAADTLELSPGFFHPPAQPDAGGVFAQIRTFERSLVPTRYARASNLFTGIAIKEHRMDANEIDKRFKAVITELGLSPDQAAALGQQIAQTDKAAAAAGIAFKSSDAQPVYLGPDGTPGIIHGGAWVALKAAGPPPELEAVIEEEKAPEEAIAVVEEEEDAPDEDYAPAIGDMSPDEFGAMLDARLGPLIKALDIAGKMGGHVDELKSMMTGVATKEAGLAAEVAALKTQLAELAGDAPRVLQGGYRASQAAGTIAPDGDARLKEAAPGSDPIMHSFGGFLNDLGLNAPGV